MNEKKKKTNENSAICVEVGTHIARLRHSHGWTQTEFAAISGVSSTYIARLEKGHHAPSIDMLQRLLTPLDTYYDVILI